MRCPADIAVASFDDLPLTDVFEPHLTAVDQPAYRIGFEGAQLLIRRVQHELKSPKKVTIRLDPELKIRESTMGAVADRRSLAAVADAVTHRRF